MFTQNYESDRLKLSDPFRKMKFFAFPLLILPLIACFTGTPTFAATEPYWNWRNPTPQGNDYQDVAYGDGRFVAVGKVGTITTSTEGLIWTGAASGVNHDISTIAYGNGRFVAKGFVNGASGLLVSDDGISWSVPNGSVPNGWNTVNIITYANDRFYALNNSSFVANLGRHFVATSSDGINWTPSTNASIQNVGRVAFGGGSYVGQNMLAGDLSSQDGVTWNYGEVSMMHSTDGITWQAGGLTGLATVSAGPIYFNDRWVVGGTLADESGGSAQFYRALSTSTDGGVTWTVAWRDPVSWTGGNQPLGDMAVLDGRLYLLGDINVPITSTADFVTMRVDVPSQLIQFQSVDAADGRVVAVGRYGRIASSTDGNNWTMLGASTVNGNLRAAAFGAGQWIAAGEAGLASSPDGIAWQMLPSGAGFTDSSIAFGNDRFVAGNIDGSVGVSTDGGATWTNSGVLGIRGQLVFAQSRFVAASGLMSSTDGVTWNAEVPSPGGTGIWTGVYQVDGVFYAIGTSDPAQTRDYVIARSVDGISWTVVAAMTERLASVGGKGDLLVASGYGGEIWTSADGVTWQGASGQPLHSYGPAASILWVGDSLVAVTLSGNVITSIDGVTWTRDEFASSGTMFTMAAGNGQVLALGAGGAIWEVGAARFTVQPESRAVSAGEAVTLSVGVTGKQPLNYQWLKNGVPVGDLQIFALSESKATQPSKAFSISGSASRTLTISTAREQDAGRYSVIVSNALGSSESTAASLVVGSTAAAPTITSQPTSQTVDAGASVTFSVSASGDAPLGYQWRKDGVAITGATGANHTIAAVTVADGGTYSVVISNAAGSVTSSNATLTVPQTNPPEINTQPDSQTIPVGTSVTFSVGATGDGTLTYQWRKDGDPIDDATAADFTIPSPTTTDSGIYSVDVQNSAGTITSTLATLTVTKAQLVNISTRAYATTGDGVTIGGFVIVGSEPKQVLIRAVGPTLATFGLPTSEVLENPVIEVYRGSSAVADNDQWGDNPNAADIAAVGQQVGATALDDNDTNSAALLMTLEPGAYTFTVRGTNNSSGIVLMEVYETDSTGASFANISTRAYAAQGNSATIGGFVVTGNMPKKILMRAVGPTLTSYGIAESQVLLDPTIELRQGTTILATNDNWVENQNAAEITNTSALIGASPLHSSDTESAALLIELEPGVYTFSVSGKDGSTGLVLAEIYDAD